MDSLCSRSASSSIHPHLASGISVQPLLLAIEPSPALLCGICGGLLSEPVIAVQCGHTFCRKCIEEASLKSSMPEQTRACSASHKEQSQQSLERDCLKAKPRPQSGTPNHSRTGTAPTSHKSQQNHVGSLQLDRRRVATKSSQNKTNTRSPVTTTPRRQLRVQQSTDVQSPNGNTNLENEARLLKSSACAHRNEEKFEGSDNEKPHGHTIEGPMCPQHGIFLDRTQLVPNIAIEQQIGDIPFYCPYVDVVHTTDVPAEALSVFSTEGVRIGFVSFSSRCKFIGTLSEVEQHMSGCGCAPQPCRNSRRCGMIPADRMLMHLATCPFTKCRNCVFGCKFSGEPSVVNSHEKTCSYLNSPLAQQGRMLTELETAFHILVENMRKISRRISAMEAKQLGLQRAALLVGIGEIPTPSSPAPTTSSNQVRTSTDLSISESFGHYAGKIDAVQQSVTATGKRMVEGQREQVENMNVSSTQNASHKDPTVSQVNHHSPKEKYATTHSLVPAIANSPGSQRNQHNNPHGARVKGMFVKPHDVFDKNGRLVMPFHFKCVGTFGAHSGPVWCLAAYETLMFTSGSEETINVWDLGLDQPMRVHILRSHEAIVHALTCHNQRLFSGDASGVVKVWDVIDFNCLLTFQATEHICAAMTCAKHILVTTSFSSISVWDIVRSRCLFSVSDDLNHWVRAVARDPSEEHIVTATHNVLHVWSSPTFKCERRLETDQGAIHSLVVTSEYVICGTYNRNIHLYSLNDLVYQGEIRGHLGTVHALSVSGCEQYLFSTSIDATVKIWNLHNRLLIQTLMRHDGSVTAVLFHKNLLFSGSADKTLKVYKPNTGLAPKADPKPPQDSSLQACWGGGKLPPAYAMRAPHKSVPRTTPTIDKIMSPVASPQKTPNSSHRQESLAMATNNIIKPEGDTSLSQRLNSYPIEQMDQDCTSNLLSRNGLQQSTSLENSQELSLSKDHLSNDQLSSSPASRHEQELKQALKFPSSPVRIGETNECVPLTSTPVRVNRTEQHDLPKDDKVQGQQSSTQVQSNLQQQQSTTSGNTKRWVLHSMTLTKPPTNPSAVHLNKKITKSNSSSLSQRSPEHKAGGVFLGFNKEALAQAAQKQQQQQQPQSQQQNHRHFSGKQMQSHELQLEPTSLEVPSKSLNSAQVTNDHRRGQVFAPSTSASNLNVIHEEPESSSNSNEAANDECIDSNKVKTPNHSPSPQTRQSPRRIRSSMRTDASVHGSMRQLPGIPNGCIEESATEVVKNSPFYLSPNQSRKEYQHTTSSPQQQTPQNVPLSPVDSSTRQSAPSSVTKNSPQRTKLPVQQERLRLQQQQQRLRQQQQQQQQKVSWHDEFNSNNCNSNNNNSDAESEGIDADGGFEEGTIDLRMMNFHSNHKSATGSQEALQENAASLSTSHPSKDQGLEAIDHVTSDLDLDPNPNTSIPQSKVECDRESNMFSFSGLDDPRIRESSLTLEQLKNLEKKQNHLRKAASKKKSRRRRKEHQLFETRSSSSEIDTTKKSSTVLSSVPKEQDKEVVSPFSHERAKLKMQHSKEAIFRYINSNPSVDQLDVLEDASNVHPLSDPGTQTVRHSQECLEKSQLKDHDENSENDDKICEISFQRQQPIQNSNKIDQRDQQIDHKEHLLLQDSRELLEQSVDLSVAVEDRVQDISNSLTSLEGELTQILVSPAILDMESAV